MAAKKKTSAEEQPTDETLAEESEEATPSIGDTGLSMMLLAPIDPTEEDYERITAEANRHYGYGPEVCTVVGTTHDVPVLPGMFIPGSTGLEDVMEIPSRYQIEPQYTVDEVKEVLAPQIEAINKGRAA